MPSAAGAEHAHAISHFCRHAVLAKYQSLVAKAASFALDDKAPQRVACLLD
jgi:hypothetical protein